MEEEIQSIVPEIVDEVEFFNNTSENTGKFHLSDILLTQLILSIIIVIIFLMMNALNPALNSKIVDEYHVQRGESSEFNVTISGIVTKISEFVNSSPNDRV